MGLQFALGTYRVEPRLGCGEVRVRGALADLGRLAVGPREGTAEPHLVDDAMDGGQRSTQPGIGGVSLAVDGEAVVDKPGPGGPGLDAGQVDAAYRELGQQLEQCAGVVIGDENNDGRTVRAGRFADRTWPADKDEPGDRVDVV